MQTDNELAHRIERIADERLRSFFGWNGAGELDQADSAARNYTLALSLRQIDNGKR